MPLTESEQLEELMTRNEMMTDDDAKRHLEGKRAAAIRDATARLEGIYEATRTIETLLVVADKHDSHAEDLLARIRDNATELRLTINR